jgi:hypothetical protein
VWLAFVGRDGAGVLEAEPPVYIALLAYYPPAPKVPLRATWYQVRRPSLLGQEYHCNPTARRNCGCRFLAANLNAKNASKSFSFQKSEPNRLRILMVV